jgi:hypothetical protein
MAACAGTLPSKAIRTTIAAGVKPEIRQPLEMWDDDRGEAGARNHLLECRRHLGARLDDQNHRTHLPNAAVVQTRCRRSRGTVGV